MVPSFGLLNCLVLVVHGPTRVVVVVVGATKIISDDTNIFLLNLWALNWAKVTGTRISISHNHSWSYMIIKWCPYFFYWIYYLILLLCILALPTYSSYVHVYMCMYTAYNACAYYSSPVVSPAKLFLLWSTTTPFI